MRSVFIIIVNYRTAPLVVQCLASLAPQLTALRGGRVVVVDNASGDGSVAHIDAAIDRQGWGSWAETIAQPHNGGFAYGNNTGIDRAREIDPRFDAVVLLNPDTLARPDAIERLVGFLESHADAGIAGGAIEDEAGCLQVSAHAKPSPVGELDEAAQFGPLSRLLAGRSTIGPKAGATSCDWVSGAFMAIRREVLDAVGPLDEGFFLYFEEVDYCVRARRHGWSCWFVPDARVMHLEGASTGIRLARRRRPAYWYASRRRFFVKCYGIAGLLAADLLWAMGRLSLVLRRSLKLGGRASLDHEPERLASDLLAGDFKAWAKGELRRIPAHS